MSVTRTRAAGQAYAYGLIGKTRERLPVPWTADPGIDDCARFCSHVIWGGKPGPISWVDNFKTAGDGTYSAGATDLQPMDVLLFDWEGNGVGNHVEFFVADQGGGYVRTYGANGSDTKAAAYRLRPKRYIMGRFRPRWAVTAGSPITTTIPTTEQEEPDMIILSNGKGQGLLTGKTLTGIPSSSDVLALRAAGVPSATVSREFYAKLQRELGAA